MKKQNKIATKKRNNRRLLIILILGLAVVLRFFKLAGLFQWSLDEEYWAYLPYNIATAYHFPLIGGHISGTGLYSGPLFIYLMSIPVFLTGGQPLGIAAFVSGLGVATTFLTYKVGSLFFGRRAGLVAALLSAASTLMVIYDRKYWNASPLPFLSLATLLSLYQVRGGKYRWCLVLALVLTIAFHAHMTSGVLLAFTALVWLIFKFPLRRKEVLLSALVFFLLQTPLLAFELRHGFTNTKAFTEFFQNSGTNPDFFSSLGEVSALQINTLGRLFYLPPGLDLARELTLCSTYAAHKFIPPAVIGLAVFFLLLTNLRRLKKIPAQLVGLLFLVNLVAVFIYRLKAPSGSWYPGQLAEYYFLPSYPAVFLLAAAALDKFGSSFRTRRLLLPLILAVFLTFNLASFFSLRHTDPLLRKQMLVWNTLQEVRSRPFRLSVSGDDPCRLYGYRYLYTVAGREPVESYLDPQFSWLYAKRLSGLKPELEINLILENGEIGYSLQPAD